MKQKIINIFNKIKKTIESKNIKNRIKKQKYIIFGIIAILLIITVVLFVVNRKKEPILMEKIITIENYKKVKVKHSKRTISKKYELKKHKIYETKDNIELNNLIGKILFVRSKDFNANVFQIREKIETNQEKMELPILMQVEQKIEYLRIGLLTYLKLDTNTKPIRELLTGKDKYDFPIPLRESIYTEKREYSGTYLTSTMEEYDINYYMDGEYLVCELVKFINIK